MNVVAEDLKFPRIPNRMLPEPSLPESPLAAPPPGVAYGRFAPAAAEVQPVEPELDDLPADGEIRIPLGQRPKAVQMVRKQHDRLLAKGKSHAGVFKGLTKGLSGASLGQERPPAIADHGEEECPTGLKRASIVGHGGELPQAAHVRNALIANVGWM